MAVHSVAQDTQMNHKTQYGPVHTFPDIVFFADSKISTSARIRISTQDSSGNIASMGRNKAGEFGLNFMTESAQKSKKNAKKVNKVTSPDKKYPDLASTRFRIHYVIKNFHSQRIQNVLDSYAAIHLIRVDGGRSCGFKSTRIRVDYTRR